MIIWGGYDGTNIGHGGPIQPEHGQLDSLLALPMRLLGEGLTRRCGLAAR